VGCVRERIGTNKGKSIIRRECRKNFINPFITAKIGEKALPEAEEQVMHPGLAFNVRRGLSPADDYNVPQRLAQAPPEGRTAAKPVAPYLNGMVDHYLLTHGVDPKSCGPWRKIMEKAGLDRGAGDL